MFSTPCKKRLRLAQCVSSVAVLVFIIFITIFIINAWRCLILYMGSRGFGINKCKIEMGPTVNTFTQIYPTCVLQRQYHISRHFRLRFVYFAQYILSSLFFYAFEYERYLSLTL